MNIDWIKKLLRDLEESRSESESEKIWIKLSVHLGYRRAVDTFAYPLRGVEKQKVRRWLEENAQRYRLPALPGEKNFSRK